MYDIKENISSCFAIFLLNEQQFWYVCDKNYGSSLTVTTTNKGSLSKCQRRGDFGVINSVWLHLSKYSQFAL